MYDSVRLLKHIRNNLLTSKRFIFPKFHQLIDPIIVPAGENVVEPASQGIRRG